MKEHDIWVIEQRVREGAEFIGELLPVAGFVALFAWISGSWLVGIGFLLAVVALFAIGAGICWLISYAAERLLIWAIRRKG